MPIILAIAGLFGVAFAFSRAKAASVRPPTPALPGSPKFPLGSVVEFFQPVQNVPPVHGTVTNLRPAPPPGTFLYIVTDGGGHDTFDVPENVIAFAS